MKAIVYDRYGPPNMLRLEDVPKPTPGDDDVLIRVHAVSLNAADVEILTGYPAYTRLLFGLFTPRTRILASDIAGTVEAVGKNVTAFQSGDEVYADIFDKRRGLAEFVCVREKQLVRKTSTLSFETVATLPQAGVLAWQGIYQSKVSAGDRVLIVGAAGGVGHFAVQMAKACGAHVTGIDSGEKLDFVRSLGAAEAIDHTRGDITRSDRQFDLILDVVGRRSVFGYRHILAPNGRYLIVGGTTLRILQVLFFGTWISRTSTVKMGILAWRSTPENIARVADLVSAGTVTPAIDRRYALRDAPEALRYLAEGHVRGKLVITL